MDRMEKIAEEPATGMSTDHSAGPGRGLGVGLILGKFMPPHRGHQYLIDFARERVNDLTVLVCSLASEPIPGRLRYDWMRELYPELRVVHVTDENPSEPHEHPLFWEIWTATIRRHMPAGPDVVFTSEEYGDELARRLGARHIAVDPGRVRVPISATRLRSDPYAYWEYLPECVRPYFAKRIAIVGPESTGKSTLAEQLAAYYRTAWVPEFAREYLDARNAEQPLAEITAAVIAEIARGQIESEDRLARQANRLLICDTELITTVLWSEHFLGGCDDRIRAAARARRYDLYLLTDIDVEWVADRQRDAPQLRAEFLNRLRDELESNGRRFILIRGSRDERLPRAVEAIDSLFADTGPERSPLENSGSGNEE
jgi:HTH-type transcriptional regulator, transcriptional repressor of NAD biosynthesis genes